MASLGAPTSPQHTYIGLSFSFSNFQYRDLASVVSHTKLKFVTLLSKFWRIHKKKKLTFEKTFRQKISFARLCEKHKNDKKNDPNPIAPYVNVDCWLCSGRVYIASRNKQCRYFYDWIFHLPDDKLLLFTPIQLKILFSFLYLLYLLNIIKNTIVGC